MFRKRLVDGNGRGSESHRNFRARLKAQTATQILAFQKLLCLANASEESDKKVEVVRPANTDANED